MGTQNAVDTEQKVQVDRDLAGGFGAPGQAVAELGRQDGVLLHFLGGQVLIDGGHFRDDPIGVDRHLGMVDGMVVRIIGRGRRGGRLRRRSRRDRIVLADAASQVAAEPFLLPDVQVRDVLDLLEQQIQQPPPPPVGGIGRAAVLRFRLVPAVARRLSGLALLAIGGAAGALHRARCPKQRSGTADRAFAHDGPSCDWGPSPSNGASRGRGASSLRFAVGL